MQNTITGTDLRQIVHYQSIKNLKSESYREPPEKFYFNETRTSYDDVSDYLMEPYGSQFTSV